MKTAMKVQSPIMRLVRRREAADHILAVQFEKPHNWQFQAGQFVDIALLDPPRDDPQDRCRTFSLASAPHEDTIMITMRLRGSAFKRALAEAPVGLPVSIDGPFGNFTLHKDATRPAVLLAGGIGITPFRSMVVQAAHRHVPQRIVLLYANGRPEDAAFLEELQALDRCDPHFTLVATMTDMHESRRSWTGHRGEIDEAMLKRSLAEMHSAMYYLAGPPGLVSGLHRVLHRLGVDDTDIRQEAFSGY